MNRLTKVILGIAVGLIVAFAGTLLPAVTNAAQSGGVIVVTPSSDDFGGAVEQVQAVTHTIEVRNDGPQNLVVNEIRLMGANAADFSFTADWPFTLAPADRRGIVVSFGPSATGAKEAVLRIVSNASNRPQFDVPLRGNGLALATLGHISATAVPTNNAPSPNDLITVEVRVNMSGANPPAHLMQNYQATLSWDPAVLLYSGVLGGDPPWGGPSSFSQSGGNAEFFDTATNGAGGDLAIIRIRFRVIGTPGSSTDLNLGFSRMEGTEVENLMPILSAGGSRVEVVAEAAPPDITVDPTFHMFGAVALGTSASHTFVVSNTGMRSLNVSSVFLSGMSADQFSIVSGGGSFTLNAGQTREVVVSFNPTTKGTKATALFFRSNDPDEFFYYVPLSGAVTFPDIVVEPTSINYGDAVLGSSVSRTLTVRNRGTATLVLSQFGLDNHQLQFAYDTGGLALLAPGQSGNIQVFFRPSTEGVKNANFIIQSNDPDTVSVTIPLSGRGIR